MDVNFEYYKIFYYVAKYNNFTEGCKGVGKQPAECDKGNELSGTAASLYASGADEPWSFSDYGRGKAVYTCSSGHGTAFYGRGGTGRMCGTVPWEYCNRSQ